MEIHTKDFDALHFSLFILSDVHEGNAGCNHAAFKKAVDYIKTVSKKRAVSVTLLGDMIDCIEVSDRRFNPVEISEKYSLRDLKDLPKKQAEFVMHTLNPIKDKIDFSIIGNHEESYIREHHFDVYNYYSEELECEKLGFFGIVRYRLKKPKRGVKDTGVSFDVGYTHGRGGSGGKTIGYPLNWCKDIFSKFDFEFNIAGHRHILRSTADVRIHINQSLRPIKRKNWYCVAGCFLDTYVKGSSGYFEGRSGGHSDIGFIEITVDWVDSTWKKDLKEIRL